MTTTMENNHKKQKVHSTRTLLDVLDDDALTIVLSRTPAADHPSLMATCSKFRQIMSSNKFHHERVQSEFVEAHAKLLTPFEQYLTGEYERMEGLEDLPKEEKTMRDELYRDYYGEFGYRKFKRYWEDRGRIQEERLEECIVRWIVDGQVVGENKFLLIPRDDRIYFTGGIFPDGKVTRGCVKASRLFFNRYGDPHLESFKKLLQKHGDNRKRVLYIEEIDLSDLKPGYGGSSSLGATLLHSFFNETEIRDEFSVVSHAIDPRSEEVQNMDRFGVNWVDSDYENHDEYDDEDNTRIKGDPSARAFLQAGFIQAMVFDIFIYLFAIPEMVRKPLLPSSAVPTLQIIESPYTYTPDPTGEVEKFFAKMVFASLFAKKERLALEEMKLDSKGGLGRFAMNPDFPELLEELRPRFRDISSFVYGELADDLGMNKVEDFIYKTLKRCSIEELLEEIRELEGYLRDYDENLQNEIAEMIHSYGENIIAESRSIHICAKHLVPDYIRMLINFVSEERKTEVINHRDNKGRTALMVAAGSSNDSLIYDPRFETCETLIELGADKNIQNSVTGATALGYLWKFYKELRDKYHCEGFKNLHTLQEEGFFEPELELLLTPQQGATAADIAYQESDDEDW